MEALTLPEVYVLLVAANDQPPAVTMVDAVAQGKAYSSLTPAQKLELAAIQYGP